jgi:hypothetical protein
MGIMSKHVAGRATLAIMWCVLAASLSSPAQQGAAMGGPLSVRTTSLPKGYLRQEYRFQLEAQGGISPLKWQFTGGSLPRGIALSEDGLLAGIPSEAGSFHFVVTVTDSGKPAQQQNQELDLQVVAPLLVAWSRDPKVAGKRVEGAVKVSNQTGQDFDLTVIVLAVSEKGRATAVGYQHFALKKNTIDLEIPFGENLPRGAYEVNVDVVAEVAATNTIYRARLVTGEKLRVQQGP